jgi:hypothetical protein
VEGFIVVGDSNGAAHDRAAAMREVLDAAGLEQVGETMFGQGSQRLGPARRQPC